jgi:hypothetical protein
MCWPQHLSQRSSFPKMIRLENCHSCLGCKQNVFEKPKLAKNFMLYGLMRFEGILTRISRSSGSTNVAKANIPP